MTAGHSFEHIERGSFFLFSAGEAFYIRIVWGVRQLIQRYQGNRVQHDVIAGINAFFISNAISEFFQGGSSRGF